MGHFGRKYLNVASVVASAGPSNVALAVACVVAAGSYRPLTFWSENAWQLSSLSKVLLIAITTVAIGFLVAVLLSRITGHLLPSAMATSLTILILGGWRSFAYPGIVLAIAVIASLGLCLTGKTTRGWIAVVVVAVYGLAPTVQVVTSHIEHVETYPLVELAPRVPVTATGEVEDILLVIVDSYPSLAITRDWFGHDIQPLKSSLTELGYTVPDIAWSHYTSTLLAVPTLLELQPVSSERQPDQWGNWRSSHQVLGGDNFLSHSVRSARFTSHHIGSGWDAVTCRDVDVCWGTPWVDEIVWQLGRDSVLGEWMVSRYGHYGIEGSLRAVESLSQLEGLFHNGTSDFVFTHLWLPHPPWVTESDCSLNSSDTGLDDGFSRLRFQLGCADKLIADVAELAGSKTAVIITSDHGTHTRGQRRIIASDWSDADIAEMLSIFLAYRLPGGCAHPHHMTNLETLRAAVACAVTVDLPSYEPAFVLGTSHPSWVDWERISALERDIRAKTLQIDEPRQLRPNP